MLSGSRGHPQAGGEDAHRGHAVSRTLHEAGVLPPGSPAPEAAAHQEGETPRPRDPRALGPPWHRRRPRPAGTVKPGRCVGALGMRTPEQANPREKPVLPRHPPSPLVLPTKKSAVDFLWSSQRQLGPGQAPGPGDNVPGVSSGCFVLPRQVSELRLRWARKADSVAGEFGRSKSCRHQTQARGSCQGKRRGPQEAGRRTQPQEAHEGPGLSASLGTVDLA